MPSEEDLESPSKDDSIETVTVNKDESRDPSDDLVRGS